MDKILTWTAASETLKVSEAAQLAGLHINTIRSAIHDNRLPAIKPTGSHWRIQKVDLSNFINHKSKLLYNPQDQIIQKLDKIIELLEKLKNGYRK